MDVNKKFVFIHIPKTGGTSLANSLNFRPQRDHLTFKESILCSNSKNFHRCIGSQGVTFSYFKFKDRLKFSVVRHPLERLVSTYYYSFTPRNLWGDAPSPLSIEHFDIYMNNIIDKLYKGNSNYWEKSNINEISKHSGQVAFWLAPQYHWIMNNNYDLLVDHILKLDNIEQDSKLFADKYNFNLRKNKKLNSTKHHSWQKHFTKKTKDFFTELYKKDFEFFGFDPNYTEQNLGDWPLSGWNDCHYKVVRSTEKKQARKKNIFL